MKEIAKTFLRYAVYAGCASLLLMLASDLVPETFSGVGTWTFMGSFMTGLAAMGFVISAIGVQVQDDY